MILIIIYSLALLFFTALWLSHNGNKSVDSDLPVSIICVVRNEGTHILDLLQSIKEQSHGNIEIVIINDESEDDTESIVKAFCTQNPEIKLTLTNLEPGERGSTPKKNGIEKAVKLASHDIIFCTDGDCTLSPDTIAEYAALFQNPEIHFAFGPVTFHSYGSIWNGLQTVEFASLMGVSAVTAFIKRPIMSSAANMCFRKETFKSISLNKELASGDDENLMNAIVERYPNGVQYVKSKAAIVQTESTPGLYSFFQQRKRWAGKWKESKNWASQLTAVFIFFVNISTLYYIFKLEWDILLVRWITEFVFLAAVLSFLGKAKKIALIPVCQLIYPFYAIFFGIVSLIPSSYTWKGRKLN